MEITAGEGVFIVVISETLPSRTFGEKEPEKED
jgi:hypothetical protein